MCHNTKHPYSPQCSCASCQDAGQFVRQYLSFRERKNLRLFPNSTCNGHCNCPNCKNAAQNEYSARLSHWRERRHERLGRDSKAIASETTPFFHLLDTSGHLQPINHEVGFGYENELKPNANSLVRINYIYHDLGGKTCPKHRPSPKNSEQYVESRYRGQVGRSNVATQHTFPARYSKNVWNTRPDVVIPFKWRNKMKINEVAENLGENELIEVKNYKIENRHGLYRKVLQQVKDRKNVKNRQQKPVGLFQTIILDFRGQEHNCNVIRDIAVQLKQKLEQETKGITIWIQVLTYKGAGCSGCSPK